MIKVETENLIKSEISNNLIGIIYFEYFNDFYFPEKGWSDFIIIMLSWWCKNIYELYDKKKYSVDLDFMDGPYRVEVVNINTTTFKLNFVHYNKEIKSILVESKTFTKEILRNSNTVLRKVNDMKYSNDDTKNLELNYKKLQLGMAQASTE